MHIFHDPGHGGSNKGICYGGLREKDWTLQFVHDYLDWRDEHNISKDLYTMARLGDIEIPYDERAKFAQAVCSDFVFIHHVNGMFWPRGGPFAGEARSEEHGLSFFVLPEDKAAFNIAKKMLDTFPPQHIWKGKTLPFHARRLTHSGEKHWTLDAYSHLKHYVRRGLPTILIEWGFATNDMDRRNLRDPIYRERMFKTLETAIEEIAKAKT